MKIPYSALRFPEKDVHTLAGKLDYLLGHPEKWSEMGLAGRKFVEDHYAIHALSHQLVELYENLLP